MSMSTLKISGDSQISLLRELKYGTSGESWGESGTIPERTVRKLFGGFNSFYDRAL